MNIKNNVMMLVNSGQVGEARKLCLKACNATPADAELWFILSAICGQMKDYAAAEKYCRKVIKLNPTVAAAHYNLAVALRGLGQFEKAKKSLEKAINIQPDLFSAVFEMGNLLLEIGKYHEAIKYYSKAISQSPEQYAVYTGIAKAYAATHEDNKAIDAYHKSLQINNNQSDVCNNLAVIYDRINNTGLAIKYYCEAIRQGYHNADVYINLGRMYNLEGSNIAAEQQYNAALEIDSKSIEAYIGLALLNEKLHNLDIAIEYIEKAYQIAPNNPYVLYNYAKILDSSRQYSRASEFYKKAISVKPDLVEAYINLGNIYLLSGNADSAYDIYSAGHVIDYGRNDLASNMLLSMNYSTKHSNDTVYNKHIDWGEKISKNIKEFVHARSSDGVIKIGYLSPDFREHSVAYFFDAILKYSNEESVINYCYSDVRSRDQITEKLEKYSDNWRDVSGLSDDSLAELIVDDGIDILVDLCGHISGNRLSVFARKPAPIQVTYLGYPNTTGLKAIDYRIVDEYTDPAGSDRFMIEKPLYLSPGFLCYTPPDDAPDISSLPYNNNGFITFGSFNNLAKITSDVIQAWSSIILAVPDSKLLLKARQFDDETIREKYIDIFSSHGVQADRVILEKYTDSTRSHLSMYGHIDVALDTFPYNGTTTTCEALWMGVPVVTYAGASHAGRVGASLLNNARLPGLVAPNVKEYIHLACQLASDTLMLSDMRSNMRKNIKFSPLFSAQDFVAQLESLFRSITNS